MVNWDISLDIPSNPVAIPDFLITSEYASYLLAENKTLLTIENCLPSYPQNPDVIAEVIHVTTTKLIKELKTFPTEAQVWIELRNNPPKGYLIHVLKNHHEEHISVAEKEFGRSAFRKRWHKYTIPST